MRRLCLLAAALMSLPPGAASARETITYGYDAKGRLTRVQHAGTVNNGVVAAYAFDRADNRTNLTVTGSPFNGPAQRIVALPLRGSPVLTLPTP